MRATAGQLPDEPRVDRPAREPVAGRVRARKQPLELRGGKVRIGNEAGSGSDQAGVELAAAPGRAPVLPDDRGCDGRARGAVPKDGGLPLVRDPDRPEVRGRDSGSPDRVLGGAEGGDPDLFGVVLDPTGLRKVLRELAVAAASHAQLVVDDQARRARRALVDREDHDRSSASTLPRTASESRPVTETVVLRRSTSSALSAHSCSRA